MGRLEDFVASHLGVATDVDGFYGAQCVDLVQAWADATGTPRFHGNAIDLAGQPNQGARWISMLAGQLPRPGDVVVWGPTPKLGIGALGHVDVVVDRVTPEDFRGLDQNWVGAGPNGSPAAYVSHSYLGVLGWHRFTALEEDEMTPEQEAKLNALYQELVESAPDAAHQNLRFAIIDTQNHLRNVVEALVTAMKPELDALAGHPDTGANAIGARIEAAIKAAGLDLSKA